MRIGRLRIEIKTAWLKKVSNQETRLQLIESSIIGIEKILRNEIEELNTATTVMNNDIDTLANRIFELQESISTIVKVLDSITKKNGNR